MERTNLVFWHTEGVMPSCIDEVFLDDEGVQRGLYSGETLEQVALRYQNPQVMDMDAFIDMRETMMRTSPREVSKEDYHSALECLPPVDWRTVNGVSSFKMLENYSGRMTSIYAHKDGKYWQFMDIDSTPAARIAEIINAL